MEAKIRAKLEELRNMLKADGGDMDVVSIAGNQVSLRLLPARHADAQTGHRTGSARRGGRDHYGFAGVRLKRIRQGGK